MVFRLSSVSKVNDANLSGKRFKAIRPEKEGFSPDVSALIMSAISRGMRDDPSLVCNLSLRSFFPIQQRASQTKWSSDAKKKLPLRFAPKQFTLIVNDDAFTFFFTTCTC